MLKITQVALVVENLEEAMRRYSKVLGVNEWKVHEPSPATKTILRGKKVDSSWRVAMANFGDVELEFLQPVKGHSIYAEFLKEGGKGVHHIADNSLDPHEADELIKRFREDNISIIQNGVFKGTVEFYYFDTRELLDGLIFETIKLTGKKFPEPDRILSKEDLMSE